MYIWFKRVIWALPLAILLSTLMSLGSVTQEVFVGLISSDNANIYDTVNDGTLTVFSAGYLEWIFYVFFFPYIILCIPIIVFIVDDNKPRKYLFKLFVSIFFSLTLMDFLFGIGEFDTYFVLINLISNFFGGMLICLIFIVSIRIILTIAELLESEKNKLSRLINSAVALSLAFLYSFFVYFLVKNMFYVTSSYVDMVLNYPMTGTYSSESSAEPGNPDGFSILGTSTSINKNVFWQGKSESFEFAFTPTEDSFNVDIRILDGCENNLKDYMDAMGSSAAVSYSGVRNLSLKLDDGLVFFRAIPNNDKLNLINISEENMEMFAITNAEKNMFNLSRFLDSKEEFKHVSIDRKTSYFMTFTNLNLIEEDLRFTNRTVNMEVDGESWDINYLPNKRIKSDAKFECKSLEKSENNEYTLESITSGIIVTVYKKALMSSDSEAVFQKFASSLRGVNGWVQAKDVNKDEMTNYIANGKVNLLLLEAQISELQIDKEMIEVTNSTSSIQIQDADLTGQLTNEGKLNFKGKFKAFILDGNRVNKSRWEKVNVAYKLLLLGLIGSILVYFSNSVSYMFKKNIKYKL